MEYKYIKRVNWPWVEVADYYTDPDPDETLIINIDEVAVVWSRTNTKYRAGVKLKSGDWIEIISADALKELKNLIIEHDRELN